MNGLEALQAMANGKTVVQIRDRKDRSPRRYDTFYKYRPKNKDDYTSDPRGSGYIWCRSRDEWAWHRCENPTEFWMRTYEDDTFEIVEDEE